MKTIEELFDNETVNKIKIDSNKFEAHGLPDLRSLIERGLIDVVGERNGELLYSTSAKGAEELSKYPTN